MSRSDSRSAGLRRRHSRTVPASIVAVVLLAVGVLAVVAAVSRLSSGRWAGQVSGPASAVAGLTWGSAAVLVASGVAVVLGLVLLVAGIKPGAYTSTRLDTSRGAGVVAERDFVISNRALARLAAGRADLVDGVEKVSASVSGSRIHLDVVTASEQRDRVRSKVVALVTEAVSAASVSPQPRVTATVRTKEL
ncbi:DUF6286 domain-containing protein [Microlunatus antarcticus]|uniref:Putative membrane protein n=1 Tax=Microlunatus antarcticus TaxID=53388 RepID=A0A7W5JW36_9ACTN|nr:DUF6286 domain-containing protein [Microlunatus antarcticus]MBB3327250.1 putative membrane protein [Microlunatus antarcticus]